MTRDKEIGEHSLGKKRVYLEHKHASAGPFQKSVPGIGKERVAAHFAEDRSL